MVIRLKQINKNGSALLAVLLSSVVIALVFFGIGEITTLSVGQLKRTTNKNEVTSLKNQIESVIQRNAACVHNLRTLNAISFGATPNYSLSQIKQESSPGVYNSPIIPSLNVPITAGSNIIVTSMVLTKAGTNDPPDPTLVTATTKLFLTDLKVAFSQPKGESVIRPAVVTVIRVETDLAGTIQTCEVIPPGGAADLCTDLGLTWDNVANDCMGTPSQICAGINGTLDGDGKCITVAVNATCPAGAFVTGFSGGAIQCTNPGTGVWSSWTACADGMRYRSCLYGSCTGAPSETCI